MDQRDGPFPRGQRHHLIGMARHHGASAPSLDDALRLQHRADHLHQPGDLKRLGQMNLGITGRIVPAATRSEI